MGKNDIFVNIGFPNELLEKIDDFRFENRFNSRAEAIRFLIEYSLKQNPDPKKEA